MYYYIADTHFGHENILKMCRRPFEDIYCCWNRVSGIRYSF